MTECTTQILAANQDAIERAAQVLRDGGLVALPTETVYGLAGDACSDSACAAIFAAKNRPSFNPLISHVHDPAQLNELVAVDDRARELIRLFWPGPLTLVLPRLPNSPLSLLTGAGLDSAAVRMPDHPVARALLRAFGGPLAAPSANRSGAVSPTRAEHVLESLGGRIPLILGGGACRVGLESTVVDLTGPRPGLLRPGSVTAEQLEQALGETVLRPDSNPDAPKSPGMLESHYAPRLSVRLNARSAEPGEALLGFGPMDCTLNLSASADAVQAAANLFAMMRDLDRPEFTAIAVAPIPETGLGAAINDRLRRAAAPRG